MPEAEDAAGEDNNVDKAKEADEDEPAPKPVKTKKKKKIMIHDIRKTL